MQPRDLTPGDRDAYPTSTTFSSGDDFTFTPDSEASRVHRGAGEERIVEHQLRPVPREHREQVNEMGMPDNGEQGRRQRSEVFSLNGKKFGLAGAEDRRATRRIKWDILVASCGTQMEDVGLRSRRTLTGRRLLIVLIHSVNEFVFGPVHTGKIWVICFYRG